MHVASASRTPIAKSTTVFNPVDEDALLRLTTCLANGGYDKEVGIMVQLNRRFWNNEQIWDAYKDVRGGGKDGRTRLLHAAESGNLSRLIFYLDRGAKVNMGSLKSGTCALMLACQNGHLKIVRELCERGANVNAAKTDNGFTALMSASLEGHLEIVRELCEHGANANAARTDDGYTALMIASHEGHLEIVRELCECGAKLLGRIMV